ncbi:MAG: glycosyltransferase [Bacteroidales bacterium]
MVYGAIVIWILTVARLLVALTNLFTRQWLQPGTPDAQPTLSILIPARDEEKNIAGILEDLTAQDYRNWEAIIYDDLSEDLTSGIVTSFVHKDPRIRLMSGKALPDGWLGKNHACHKLAQEATGDYLLFLDADVRLGYRALSDTMAHAQRHQTALLSIFPYQHMVSFGEKISVPLMTWVLLSLLPLICTRRCAGPSLSAANGQFMLFKAGIYHDKQFHKHFRKTAAEDIAIARYMKQQGLRIHTITGSRQVACRMYRSLKEAAEGFSRNIIAYFGDSVIATTLFTLITTLGVIPVGLSMGWAIAVIFLGVSLLIRITAATITGQPVMFTILTAPVQQLVFAGIASRAIYHKFRKRNRWKGRLIEV